MKGELVDGGDLVLISRGTRFSNLTPRSYIHPAIELTSDNISAEFAFLVDRRHRSAWASFNDDNQTAVFSFMATRYYRHH
jgi:hypothetical protein